MYVSREMHPAVQFHSMPEAVDVDNHVPINEVYPLSDPFVTMKDRKSGYRFHTNELELALKHFISLI